VHFIGPLEPRLARPAALDPQDNLFTLMMASLHRHEMCEGDVFPETPVASLKFH
jgi:hypothetical protein